MGGGGFKIPLDFVKNGVKCTLLLGFDATDSFHSLFAAVCLQVYPPQTSHSLFTKHSTFFFETKDFLKNKNRMPLELREDACGCLGDFKRSDTLAALLETHTLLRVQPVTSLW